MAQQTITKLEHQAIEFVDHTQLLRMASSAPQGATERNFAALLLLHELGHRDSANSALGPASDPHEEERRADSFAVDSYVRIPGRTLSELIDEVWNVAEGGFLTRLTQYDQFDPLREYAPHGSFFRRVSRLYQRWRRKSGHCDKWKLCFTNAG